jgi:hypothetical protein
VRSGEEIDREQDPGKRRPIPQGRRQGIAREICRHIGHRQAQNTRPDHDGWHYSESSAAFHGRTEYPYGSTHTLYRQLRGAFFARQAVDTNLS